MRKSKILKKRKNLKKLKVLKKFKLLERFEKLPFIVKFFIYLIPLFGLWYVIGLYYVKLIMVLVRGFLSIAGYSLTNMGNMWYSVIQNGLRIQLDMSSSALIDFNIVPFFALLFATKTKWERKLKFSLIGFFILLLMHAITFSVYVPYLLTQSEGLYYIYNLSVILGPALPFLLWFLISFPDKEKKL